MSSSSVCQGLQSCLEPRLMEPRVLRLKLAPAKSNFSRSIAHTSCFAHADNLKNESHTEENTTTTTITATDNKNNRDDDCDVKSRKIDDIGGWSFLQFLANNSQNDTKDNTENEKVYVHPLVKRSSSALSEKSLEMCTESLGCETGSQVSESSDDISLISPEIEISSPTDTSKFRDSFMTKRTNRSVSFPPPLTSISGSSGVQVRPHREGGRLVLQAVAVSSSQAYFHAERRDGRLRLCLVKDRPPAHIDNQEEDAADDEGGGGEEEEEEEEEEWIEEEEKVEEEYDEDEEEEDDEVYWGEDMEGKSKKVRGQIGVEKLGRPLRCKESGRGNKGLLNWEPFWVAT